MLQVMMASYLTQATGIEHRTRWLKASLGDAHIYKNHIDACRELFERVPSEKTPSFKSPEEYGILQYMLKYAPNLADNLNALTVVQARGNLLRRTYEGVSGYVPGKSIKGERNV